MSSSVSTASVSVVERLPRLKRTRGLFIDNSDLPLKRPPTAREPSARLKENVTVDIIDPANDALLLAAIQLREDESGNCSPHIIDLAVFSMIQCVRSRDARLAETGGLWIGKCRR